MTRRTRDHPPLDPIGLCREDAAAFIGVSPSFFKQLVDLGVMPKPKVLGAKRLWDRKAIEKAWNRIPEMGEVAPESDDPWSHPIA